MPTSTPTADPLSSCDLAYVSAIALICAGVKDGDFACASSVAPMTNASSHGMITSRFIVALRRPPERLTPIPKQNDHISVRVRAYRRDRAPAGTCDHFGPDTQRVHADREPCCLGESQGTASGGGCARIGWRSSATAAFRCPRR